MTASSPDRSQSSATPKSEELLLPPAARLLHIGVHKSGTTSLQSAFHSARGQLGQFGVMYRGGPEHHPAVAVTGARGLRGNAQASMGDWDELVEAVKGAGDDRVVVSSEYFSNASEEAVHKVVSELKDAGGPLHVVVTLRPIYKIAPSQWQQYVQNAIRAPFIEWLDGMFCQPPYENPTPTFWRRHDQAELVRRWAAEIGPKNVTVVVVNDREPGMVMRTFESFVGLPEGFLVPKESAVNRSLTMGEVELVRRLNDHFKTKKWSDAAYASFVRRGAVHRVKIGRTPGPDEPRLPMPRWAMERAAEIGARAAETISALDVNIVGDVASLGAIPDDIPDVDEDSISNPVVPVAVATQATIGAIESGMKIEKQAEKVKKQLSESEKRVAMLERRIAELENDAATPSMDPFRAKELIGEAARRASRRITGGNRA